MGNDKPVAAEVGEVITAVEFYDYDAKYNSPDSQTIIPAGMPKEKRDAIRTQAVRIYKTLGCEGLSRVDFFVDKENGEILFNEINTIPGFTPISMYPKLFEAVGVSYSETIDRLINLALDRGGKI